MGLHGVGIRARRRQLDILLILAAGVGRLTFPFEACCQAQMTLSVTGRQLDGSFEYRNRRGIIPRLLKSRGEVALRRRVRGVQTSRDAVLADRTVPVQSLRQRVSQIEVVGPVPRSELGRAEKRATASSICPERSSARPRLFSASGSSGRFASASSARARAAASSAAVGSAPPFRLASREVAEKRLTSPAGTAAGPELGDGEAVEAGRRGASVPADD